MEPIADADIKLIAREEVVQALSKMKCGKAVDPDGIPAEAWKCLGEPRIDFLMSLFNEIVHSNMMPKEWRHSILVPIYKGKGDVQNCRNYRAGVPNPWPAGRMRPTRPLGAARRALLELTLGVTRLRK